jgi:polyisoprenoid-binding protein YceI
MTDTASRTGLNGLETGTWTLDAGQSRFEFRVKHFWAIMTVRGHFTKFEGKAEVDAAGSILVTVRIDATSVNSKQKQRDKHLRSADFFDVANHSAVTFASRRVAALGTDRLSVEGDLSVAGHSQPIAFEARLSEMSGKSLTADAEVSVDRTTFAMTWSPLGMASSTAVLVAHAQFIKS